MLRHEFLHQNAKHLPVRSRPFVETIIIGDGAMVITEETLLLYERARAGGFATLQAAVPVERMERTVEEVFAMPEAESLPPTRAARAEATPATPSPGRAAAWTAAARALLTGMTLPPIRWELFGGKRTFLSLLVALPAIVFLLLRLTQLPALPVIATATGVGLLILGVRAVDRAYGWHVGQHARTGARFAFTTGAIFAVLFIGLNFHAYWDRVSYFVQGGPSSANSERGRILEQLLPDATPVEEPAPAEEANAPATPEVDLSANLVSRQELLTFDAFAVAPPDDRLIIPKLGKNIPIVRTSEDALLAQDWATLEKQIQSDLRNGVVHYPGTASPGEKGNVFITGHSSYYPWDPGRYKSVFAVLDQLVVGDQVVVYSKGEKYVYTARKIEVVPPSRTEVLSQPLDRSILTLMTCTPVGTATNRLIVQFDQVSPDPSLNRTPTLNDGSRIRTLPA